MFAGKEKLIPLNMQAVALGLDYAKQNFKCPLDFRVSPLDKTRDKVMIDGNTAAGTRVLSLAVPRSAHGIPSRHPPP